MIIFTGLIVHAVVSFWAMMAMQKEQNRNSKYVQLRQQQHEVEFAKEQARMFRESQVQKPSTKTSRQSNA